MLLLNNIARPSVTIPVASLNVADAERRSGIDREDRPEVEDVVGGPRSTFRIIEKEGVSCQ
jgi:hypothetical protein